MRAIARSLGVVLLALIGAIALALSATMTTVAQLLATTALIMGGTGHPLSVPPDTNEFVEAYTATAVGHMTPTQGAPDAAVVVVTPEEFFPVYGTKTFDDSVAEGVPLLHAKVIQYGTGADENNEPNSVVVYGYSQSARVATIEKRNLIEYYSDPANSEETPPNARFFLVANPGKPNGGILQRLEPLGGVPFAGITFDGATPTDSDVDGDGTHEFPTDDYAIQYDGWADFPEEPLNLVATGNAIAGIYYLHGDYANRDFADAEFQGTTGDTDYYIFETEIVPLLMPLQDAGVPKPILLVLDAPLREVIEDGYARDTPPGEPTPAKLIPFNNPIALIGNVAGSIPVGIDDGLEEAGLGRALGTTEAGMYGVSGPDGPVNSPATTSAAEATGSTTTPAPETNLAAAPPAADPPATEPENVDSVVEDKTDDTSDDQCEGTRPRPVRSLIRGPIGSDLPKPRALRPSGDRPLKKALNALTGQRPTNNTSESATGDTSDTSSSEDGGRHSAAE